MKSSNTPPEEGNTNEPSYAATREDMLPKGKGFYSREYPGSEG